MRINFNGDKINVMTYTGTVAGRNPAGIYIQFDNSIQFGFSKNYHALRNGTRVLASVKYPPKDDSSCVQVDIDSILSYADAA